MLHLLCRLPIYAKHETLGIQAYIVCV